MGSIRREIHAVLPTAAVENMKTLEEVRDDSLATRTFAMQLLAGFSIIGSVLTLVGIYGVLSLSVASRRRELAIRAAVGAEARDIRNLIFGEGFRLIAGGHSGRIDCSDRIFARAAGVPVWSGANRSADADRSGRRICNCRHARVLGAGKARNGRRSG